MIALETIHVDRRVTFHGIDLDTGARIQVCVDRPQLSLSRQALSPNCNYAATGLLLTLRIEPVTHNG